MGPPGFCSGAEPSVYTSMRAHAASCIGILGCATSAACTSRRTTSHSGGDITARSLHAVSPDGDESPSSVPPHQRNGRTASRAVSYSMWPGAGSVVTDMLIPCQNRPAGSYLFIVIRDHVVAMMIGLISIRSMAQKKAASSCGWGDEWRARYSPAAGASSPTRVPMGVPPHPGTCRRTRCALRWHPTGSAPIRREEGTSQAARRLRAPMLTHPIPLPPQVDSLLGVFR